MILKLSILGKVLYFCQNIKKMAQMLELIKQKALNGQIVEEKFAKLEKNCEFRKLIPKH